MRGIHPQMIIRVPGNARTLEVKIKASKTKNDTVIAKIENNAKVLPYFL